MPFETTQNLPANPLVTVKFSGLMVLQPGPNNTCDVAVHRFNLTHLFQAILVISKPNQPATLITLFTGPLQGQFMIRLDPEPAESNFKVFQKEPFTHTAQGSDPKDARWAINLQSDAGDIKVTEGGLPFVTLKTGVLFTPSLSDKELKPKLKRPPATTEMDLEHIAPELAVAIAPPPRTGVELEWKDFGTIYTKRLPLDNDASTRYTVYFINEPPSLNFEEHDEMRLYYKILRKNGAEIPKEEQCILTFEKPPFERLDQIPCNPVTLNP